MKRDEWRQYENSRIQYQDLVDMGDGEGCGRGLVARGLELEFSGSGSFLFQYVLLLRKVPKHKIW